MRSRSARTTRGWVYAVLIAAALSAAFYGMIELQTSRMASFVEQRTASHVVVRSELLSQPKEPVALEWECELEAPISSLETAVAELSQSGLGVEANLEVNKRRTLASEIPPRRSAHAATAVIEKDTLASLAQIGQDANHRPSELGLNQLGNDASVKEGTRTGLTLQPPVSTRPVTSLPSISELSTPFPQRDSRFSTVSVKRSSALDNATTVVPVSEYLAAQPAELSSERNLLQVYREDIEKLIEVAQRNQDTEAEGWLVTVRRLLDEWEADRRLSHFRELPPREAIELITREALESHTRFQFDPDLQSRFARVAYKIYRFAVLQKFIERCTSEEARERLVSTRSGFDIAALRAAYDRLDQWTRSSSMTSWRDYLMLDEFQSIIGVGDLQFSSASKLAQEYLTRTRLRQLAPQQQQMVQDPRVVQFGELLAPLAAKPVNFDLLLRDLEALEKDSISRVRDSLAATRFAAAFSGSPAAQQLANEINVHYRNANLRFAISQELVERFLPKQQMDQRPVRETILGAYTRGNAHVDTKLGIELIPDPATWNLRLDLTGAFVSDTRSSRGPATFFNNSQAVIETSRHIRVDAAGLRVMSRDAEVSSNDSLQGFSTDYDGLPIVGDLVRYIAKQQFDQSKGIAQRIVRRNIAAQTDAELDRTLQSQIQQAEQQFDDLILSPLGELDLNPMVYDLQTTESRLVARYRIAASDQLAAFTPRPLAPSDSHLSTQIHESLINNTIDQIGLGERYWTLQELCDLLATRFKQNPWKIPDEVPNDVKIKFAPHRPVTVQFLDDRLELTLRIAEIRNNDRLKLDHFIIKTSYVFEADGLNVNLVRDGVVSVDGYRIGIRERLPLRVIFEKVFGSRQIVSIVSPNIATGPRAQGLAVSQLVSRDGWLGIAISDQESPHVAVLQSPAPLRTR